MGQGPFSTLSPARSPVSQPLSPGLHFSSQSMFLVKPARSWDTGVSSCLGFCVPDCSLQGPCESFHTGKGRGGQRPVLTATTCGQAQGGNTSLPIAHFRARPGELPVQPTVLTPRGVLPPGQLEQEYSLSLLSGVQHTGGRRSEQTCLPVPSQAKQQWL